jgi:putative colanic acid biosynthesis glycosyltransferase
MSGGPARADVAGIARPEPERMARDVPALLSVITVVRNDLAGLRATIASVRRHSATMPIEHIVVDGSTDDRIQHELEGIPPFRALIARAGMAGGMELRWVSESDRGIFDAMNKGLAMARCRYALFMNAGDLLSASVDWQALAGLLQADDHVLLGYAIEHYGRDRYLRPGIGQERMVFTSPAHPATFYPRRFYAVERYRLDLLVGSDGDFTHRALKTCGGLFVPVVVAEFALGGVSSTYGSLRVLRQRLAEDRTPIGQLKLLLKYALWRLLPRRYFYRVLGAYKYTRLGEEELPPLLDKCLELRHH